jgi:hypothetical protein
VNCAWKLGHKLKIGTAAVALRRQGHSLNTAQAIVTSMLDEDGGYSESATRSEKKKNKGTEPTSRNWCAHWPAKEN